MTGTMQLRGHLDLLDNDMWRSGDDLWPKTLACPCCGERLHAERYEVEELMLADSRGWTASCPSCYRALVAKVERGVLHLWPREAPEG